MYCLCAEVEAAFIAADVDGSGFICVSNARAIVSGSYVSLMLEHLSQNAAASPCVSVTYVSLTVMHVSLMALMRTRFIDFEEFSAMEM